MGDVTGIIDALDRIALKRLFALLDSEASISTKAHKTPTWCKDFNFIYKNR